jgi:hypothetical protein
MIPMTQIPVLLEPSFADAIGIIAASAELPEQTRRHWATSLRQIAKALDKPLELIPARYSAISKDLAHLHEVPAGLTAKTLRNHKSNVKGALLWLAREKDVPRHGAPLTPPWEALRVEIEKRRTRHRLSSLMRALPLTRSMRRSSTVLWTIAISAEWRLMMRSGASWPGHGIRMLGLSGAGQRAGS